MTATKAMKSDWSEPETLEGEDMYEISFDHNGYSGSRLVRAASAGEALTRFAELWSTDGDEPPASPWVSGCWGQS